MTKTQTQTRATSAADVRKVGKTFLATVRKDGLSAVRTNPDKYAALWSDVEAYVGEAEAVSALEVAEVEHATATAALEAARAAEESARDALKVATSYRQAIADMRRTVGLEMIALGVTGRQTARILGVTEGAIRKWKKSVKGETDAPKDDAPKDDAKDDAPTAPTPDEVRRALDAVAALISGLEPVASVKVMTSLETRVSKVTAALADLQKRSAEAARNVA